MAEGSKIGTVNGSKKRVSHTELLGEETDTAKPDILKVARLTVTQ